MTPPRSPESEPTASPVAGPDNGDGSAAPNRVAMLTKEWPPEIYGGAGVHVTELTPQLRELAPVDVYCTGADRPDSPDVSVSHPDAAIPEDTNPALLSMSTGIAMAAAVRPDTAVVHSHTWYAGLAGHLAAQLLGVPHVVTAHSLEPRRPWKAEQLGGGYRISSWSERNAFANAAAVIAVSAGMAADVLEVYPELDPARVHVVRNGIDTTRWYPVQTRAVLERYGVDLDAPIVAFVGRITRQKGVEHLIAATHEFAPDTQLVLCAGAPDTPEIGAATAAAVGELSQARPGRVFWIEEMLPIESVREVLSAATVFVCPSVYEPLGIVNLEAMACSTAVVGSRVGGIPEVIDEGSTGLLVPPGDPDALAAAVNSLVADPGRAAVFGAAGRARAVSEFSWASIAAQTLEVYRAAGATL